jgi:ubiquinone biosynthesis protein UbiJ
MDIKNLSKEQLIDLIFFLSEIQGDVWRYHPNNPEKIDIVEQYDAVSEEIEEIKKQLDSLED